MTYEYKTAPWKHQQEALRQGWKKDGFAYLMEMGTGKSKVAVDEATLYFESAMVTGWVVMAPKGVYRNWVREGGELDTHMPDRVREKAVMAIWEPGGGNRTNRALLEKALTSGPGLRILVMNTEAIQTKGKARAYLEKFLELHSVIFHLDESTMIKNPSASRTKYILSLTELIEYRRILTGSPVTRSPLDIFSQFEFMKPGSLGHRNFYSFRSRYAVMERKNFGGRSIDIVVGYRNVEDLKLHIQDHSFRVLKEECLDLPPKTYTQRDVDMTPEQERLYAEIRDDAFSVLGDDQSFVSTQAVITQIMRLRQVLCGHVKDDDGVVHDIPSNRLSVLEDIVADLDSKIVIWSAYRRDIESIAQALKKTYGENSVAQYHGGNVGTRQDDVTRFLNDPECRFMISNAQSGGYGNTWIVADTVIYYSNDYDLEKRIQSEDRVHRGGQTKKVTYIDLITPGTVDEKIVTALRKKIDIATLITGDVYREWLV